MAMWCAWAPTRSTSCLRSRRRGAVPHPDLEPTIDQVSAMFQVLREGAVAAVPYVDFAIFGPRNTKTTSLDLLLPAARQHMEEHGVSRTT
eukprot:2508701-Amphidinium_carterae.1